MKPAIKDVLIFSENNKQDELISLIACICIYRQS